MTKQDPRLSRRELLKMAAATTLALPAVPQVAAAQEFEENRGSRVGWARMRFPVRDRGYNDWYHHPYGDLNLVDQIRKTTNINIEYKWNQADIDDLEQMCGYPFIFMHAQSAITLTDRQRAHMKEYMNRGGFVFIDDCVYEPVPDTFFLSMREEMARVFPRAKVVELEPGHEVFQTVYELPKLPYVQGKDHGLWGVYEKDRLVAMLCAIDLHCGWAQWFGQEVERESLKMGVNIYAYAMTH